MRKRSSSPFCDIPSPRSKRLFIPVICWHFTHPPASSFVNGVVEGLALLGAPPYRPLDSNNEIMTIYNIRG